MGIEEERPDIIMTVDDLIYASNELDLDKNWNLVTFGSISPITGCHICTIDGRLYRYCYPIWDDDRKVLEVRNNVLKYAERR